MGAGRLEEAIIGLPNSLQQAINEYLNGAPFSEVLADGERLSQGYVKGKGETPHVVTKRDVQDMAIRIPSIYDEPYSYLVAARRLRSDGTGRIVDTPRVPSTQSSCRYVAAQERFELMQRNVLAQHIERFGRPADGGSGSTSTNKDSMSVRFPYYVRG